MKKAFNYHYSLGEITLAEEDGRLTEVIFKDEKIRGPWEPGETPLLRETDRQLREYLDGRRKVFDLPLRQVGTEFERTVWAALLTIPWGETRTYADIARQIGRPSACRAVGRANGLNPISIIVPCHRVIGSNGRLTGYAGGLDLKERLLRLEGRKDD
jgi:O-6-methylguanine DNA methyltransferase